MSRALWAALEAVSTTFERDPSKVLFGPIERPVDRAVEVVPQGVRDEKLGEARSVDPANEHFI